MNIGLPAVVIDGRRTHIPLSSAQADRVAELLLVPDLQKRRHRFAEFILTEPALALWIAKCSLSCNQSAEITSCRQAADWFDENGCRLLGTAPSHFPAEVEAWQTWRAVRLQKAGSPNVDSMLESTAFFTALTELDATIPPAASAQPNPVDQSNHRLFQWAQRLEGLRLDAENDSCNSEHFLASLQQAKLEACKELAYGASHEINNPLANIATRAQSLLLDEESPVKLEAFETIYAQAMRAHEMISDLMLFARPPEPEWGRVDLCEIAKTAANDWRSLARLSHIELLNDAGAHGLFAHGDSNQLTVALGALLRNAIEAIGHDGKIVIEGQRDDDTCVLHVHDSGPGVDLAIADRLFEPFYSGREAGRGLGFGLSKCWQIAQLHGGSVKFLPAQIGSLVELRLPSLEPSHSPGR